MRSARIRWTQFLVAGALLTIAYFLSYQKDIYEYRYMAVDLTPRNWVEGRPAGEITREFTLSQALDIQETELLERDFGEPFCVNLLMANYANRRNRGSFTVTVTTTEGRQQKRIPAETVVDNQYLKVCFDELRFDQLYNKPATLDIAGVDGEPGRSVTAWLSNARDGARARVNGQPTDLTLVHTVVLLKDTRNYQFNAYFLLLFAGLLGGALLTAMRHPDAI
ncbi:MAG: hypothetical protein ACK40L_13475 [Hydrogenophaga sp.]